MTVKVLLSLIISVFVLTSIVYAQSGINIVTNNDSFAAGETIQVTGTITNGQQGQLVAIEIKNPEGETVLVRTVTTGLRGSFSLPFKIPDTSQSGSYQIITSAQVAGQSLSGSKTISVSQQKTPTQTQTQTESEGGCLIATAAYGSELAQQVQLLREVRDNTLLKTTSGVSFMTGFNQLYYSFSPTIADLERQSPAIKELVKLTITPMITTLSILNYLEIDSEEEMLGYGIGIILLNMGIYFAAPTIIVTKLWRRRK